MASGRPDWYSSVAMHGKFDDKYIGIAVDIAGHMLAKMQGEKLDETLKTIAVGDDGIMKANLAVQDLMPLRVMPFYGGAERDGTSVGVEDSHDTRLKLVTATGVILGGFWHWHDDGSAKDGLCSLHVDDKVIATMYCDGLHGKGIDDPESYPIFVTQYDDMTWYYTVCLTKGIPFERNVALYFYHTQGHNISVTWEFVWAELT